jgi:hypothetical protein
MIPIECHEDLVAALSSHLVRFERFANCGHSVIADAHYAPSWSFATSSQGDKRCPGPPGSERAVKVNSGHSTRAVASASTSLAVDPYD